MTMDYLLAVLGILAMHAVVLVAQAAAGDNSSLPLVLWTQHSHRFSKIRGIPASAWRDAAIDTRSYFYSNGRTTVDSFQFGLGYNWVTSELVWSELANSTIQRQHVSAVLAKDGAGPETLVTLPAGSIVTGVDVDALTGAVYFVDKEHGWVGVVSALGQDIYKVLYDRQVEAPEDIAVDPDLGLLFWSESGANPRIQVASSAGGPETLSTVAGDLQDPQGVVLDRVNRTVYWVDRGAFTLERDAYSGGQRETVYQFPEQLTLHGIALYQNYAYITTAEDLRLYIIDVSAGRLMRTFDVDAFAYKVAAITEPVPSPGHECDDMHCSHVCVNKGSRQGTCLCMAGYFLNPDGRNCVVGSAPVYVYSTGDAVRMVDASLTTTASGDTQVKITPVSTLVYDETKDIRSIATHHRDGLLYFADIASGAIYKENIATDYNEWMHTSQITVQTGEVLGLAVDWLAGNLYWSDHMYEHIMMSQLDGRYHSIVLREAGPVRGIAVSPTEGRMYWASGSVIETATLSGQSRARMVEDLWQPQAVTVDSRTRRLYWTDVAAGVVQSISLASAAGGGLTTLTMNTTGMHGLTVYQSTLTWTKTGLGLQFCPTDHYTPYTATTTEALTSLTRFYDVVAHGNYLQPLAPVGCQLAGGGCHHLCLPAPAARWSCGCAIGFSLSDDGYSCQSQLPSSGGALMFVDPYHKQMYVQGLEGGEAQVQGLPIQDQSFPLAVELDVTTGRVYWVDHGLKVIASAELDGSKQTVLIQYNEDSTPISLSHDYSTGRLYYIDQKQGSISWLSTEDDAKGTMLKNLNNPKSFAVDVKNGMLYWSSEEDGEVVIKRVTTEGEGQPEIIAAGLMDVPGLALYTEELLLYYCDAVLGQIGYIDLNATFPVTPTVLYRSTGSQFRRVAVSNEHVYFTIWNQKGITRIKREFGVDPQRFTEFIFARLADLKLYESISPAASVAVPPPFPLVPIVASSAVLLVLLLAALILSLLLCRRHKAGASGSSSPGSPASSTASSGQHLRDSLDHDIEWMDFENPALYDIRAAHAEINKVSEKPDFTESSPSISPTGEKGGGDDLTPTRPPPGAGATKTPLAIVSGSSRKFQQNRKSAGSKKSTRRGRASPGGAGGGGVSAEFALSEKQRVATVLQRIVGRMRNNLSSVLWTDPSASSAQPAAPTPGAHTSAVPAGVIRPGARLVHIPPRLHDPPRGWAPASHNVPTNIRRSWGRARAQQAAEASGMSLPR